jgi:hypothetical protein
VRVARNRSFKFLVYVVIWIPVLGKCLWQRQLPTYQFHYDVGDVFYEERGYLIHPRLMHDAEKSLEAQARPNQTLLTMLI